MNNCCKDKINISVYLNNNHANVGHVVGWSVGEMAFYKSYNGQWVNVYTGTKPDVEQINLKLANLRIPFKNEIVLLK